VTLRSTQGYALLAKHGVFALSACDRCGAILGAVRYTRRGDAGEWCSAACRGDGERQVVRRGGRPRKYRSAEDSRSAKTAQQRGYRRVAVWKKLPRSLAETKDLQTQKAPPSHYPLTPASLECRTR
jgi:hypothetical protein